MNLDRVCDRFAVIFFRLTIQFYSAKLLLEKGENHEKQVTSQAKNSEWQKIR